MPSFGLNSFIRLLYVRDAFNVGLFSYEWALGRYDITISAVCKCQKRFHFMWWSVVYFLHLQIGYCSTVERRESQEPSAMPTKPLLTFKIKLEVCIDSDVTSVYSFCNAGYGQKANCIYFDGYCDFIHYSQSQQNIVM